jgi:hypothetical protein
VTRRRPKLSVGIGVLVATLASSAAVAGPAETVIEAALDVACTDETDLVERLAAAPAIALAADRAVSPAASTEGRRHLSLPLDDGASLVVDRLRPAGVLRRVTVEYDAPTPGGGSRPSLLVVADSDCAVIDARRLAYDEQGLATTLEHLGGDLELVDFTEPLNPPVPDGRDPDGVTVALFDSGINYTLPLFADRLARDAAGRFLGYDYWDDDERPFDASTKAGPFFPLHHGTTVASVLLREAPRVRLLPYRYPDPDMARMADLVAAADRNGARIVAMPMGSDRPEDWPAFLDAARQRPHMLFVLSAGNDGRDLDRSPLYPAAAGLDNFLVVTSATPFGRIAPGSNWGADTVDLMVPAERVAVVDHRGAPAKASGSSYAVPRVAALAARLLADHPEWRAPELKAAILGRAHPSPYQKTRVTRHGWVANPADDG